MTPIYTACAGGIVIGDRGTVALVRNQETTLWFFPKGKVDPGETDEEAARREIAEEAGLINLEYLDDLGTYERPRIVPDGTYKEDEVKRIHMYLFAAEPGAAVDASMEIAEAAWIPLPKVLESLENAKDRAWFTTVFERVRHAVQRD